MRVATWNVNGLRSRFDFVAHWLAARQPDLVGLQELKLTDEQFPEREFEQLGYHSYAHGQKAWNGVAVLSRTGAEVVQSGLPGQEELGARLITVRVDGLTFTTVYVPNGKSVEHEDFPRKLVWLDALREQVQGQASTGPSVLCGDFNLCPTSLDTWNEKGLQGKIFHTTEERNRFRDLTEDGWVDLFRHHHPDREAYSWWDYRGGAFHRGMGLRIDFLFASPAFADRVTAVEIDREYRKKKDGLTASDHAPVWCDASGVS